MVKLTAEIIQNSMQYINPVKDRELDLRGYRIPEIENLGATGDQYDTIDFSDNDIRKLDGFPFLQRLKCLLLNNNRIVRIGEHLEEYIPNLESLILTGNQIEDLGDIDPLVTLEQLSTLSLMFNPITSKQHYRSYVIYKLPQLKLLDFRKIKLKEREEAKALFKSKKGKDIQKEIAKKAKTFVPGGSVNNVARNKGLNDEEIKMIREAINKASSLQEVERLQKILQSGQIPGNIFDSRNQNGGTSMDYE
ncbi:U2 small nuclear ribonucleoprotein A' [Diorhabda carinulata]|uniref:U2 small nuclear ribonucleoprotein A' n=1 Tax=Diorhabda carinulata TaxID=1163345 RepID=UPI0024E0E409|nr:U2 small nuclear ribonucleoprotein A' isoform X2 [Diorhabda sublineata]XP_057664827.1 U2 small nuclear ribonucleoprotein A' [Diorhabda carinulata]